MQGVIYLKTQKDTPQGSGQQKPKTDSTPKRKFETEALQQKANGGDTIPILDPDMSAYIKRYKDSRTP